MARKVVVVDDEKPIADILDYKPLFSKCSSSVRLHC